MDQTQPKMADLKPHTSSRSRRSSQTRSRIAACVRSVTSGLLLAVSVAACGPEWTAAQDDQDASPFATGADRLVASDFLILEGMRVGLITNQTAMVGSTHLIDLLHASESREVVDLAALFGLEHGLRGGAAAGAGVSDGVDDSTGTPVYSLYGERRSPPDEVLANLDVMVFDVQDVGARFYTYISTMGLAMQAAARAGIPFVVLDRPNPLGGDYVSGFVAEPAYFSFVGAYPIPIAHGLTVGELAQLIKGEALMNGLETLDLRVVEMTGWKRSQQWPDLGRDWIPTSPNIPEFETALVYPGACLFEATTLSEGRGTREPFKIVGGPGVDGQAMAEDLQRLGLPGVGFEAVIFTPQSIPGMSPNPKHLGAPLEGVRQIIIDRRAYRPLETAIYMLDLFLKQISPDDRSTVLREEWMGRLSGTGRLYEMLAAGTEPADIIDAWSVEVAAFRDLRSRYLLY